MSAVAATEFSVVIVQLDGAVTDSRVESFSKLRSNELMRQVITGFHGLLREKIPDVIQESVRFRVSLPFDSQDVWLHWSQPHSFCAIALIGVGEKPAFTCLFLFGGEPTSDAVAVESAQELFVKLGKDMKIKVKRTLESITARPAVICVPWPLPLATIEQARFAVWITGLGAAFFERIEDLVAQAESQLRAQGNRHCPGNLDASDN